MGFFAYERGGARVVRERVSRGSDEGVMRRSGGEIERGLMMANEDLREQRRGEEVTGSG